MVGATQTADGTAGALRYIDREDLVVQVLEPPPLPAAPLSQPAWSGSPYPGLRHFSDQETAIFFGRGEEIRELLKRLDDPLQRFIAVVGASGSGKSSLVIAGVIPRLPDGWIPVRFTPGGLGDDPFLALAAKLESLLEPHGLTGRTIADRLRARGDLDALARLVLDQQSPTAELLLFVDQFEELFTLVAAEHQRRFVALLAKAAESPRVRTILTVRADFYPQCIDAGLDPVASGFLSAGGAEAAGAAGDDHRTGGVGRAANSRTACRGSCWRTRARDRASWRCWPSPWRNCTGRAGRTGR